jgi:hypothetical protein
MTVYDAEGNNVYDLCLILEKWRNDFSNLLNSPDDERFDDSFYRESLLEKNCMEDCMLYDNNNLNAEIGVTELKYLLRKLNTNKSVGVDAIPNEILKNENIFIQLLNLINKFFMTSTVPSIWWKAVISPIPKCSSKDPKIPLNYRGISLLSCMGKLFSSLINSRINTFVSIVKIHKFLKMNRMASGQKGHVRTTYL